MDNWIHQLEVKLTQQYGKKMGCDLSKIYASSFHAAYKEINDVDRAISDIQYMEALSEKQPVTVNLYASGSKDKQQLHVRVFKWGKTVALSDILPMLENFDLRTVSQSTYSSQIDKKESLWINDFLVEYKQPSFEISKSIDLFQDAFTRVYCGTAENDGFNKLILGANLSWREVIILRTYAKYLHQIGFRFAQPYIEQVLVKHASLATNLVLLFKTMHDPALIKTAKKTTIRLEKSILNALEDIPELDEDTVIRRLLDLMKATLRTNYYQKNNEKTFKEYLAIKLNSRSIPDLPLPKPLFETFIYSSRFEGIHLRNDKIARGGIRWSDRLSDYRTEVLGLMKAQVVKNAVIVPSGAKGGFTLKALTLPATREIIQKEVIACYTLFISGLLDLVDNIVANKVIPPANVVCHDPEDTYLVVAADKGTASFSDLANSIAASYHFWLGDAFASGGSVGYDHKKMGITAKGAWESAKRHFRELDIDINAATITVVGIGDMSGDVFGNGMIYSNHIKLIAAFDHRHIFIDPTPNPEKSFKERERLFNLPTSSWDDYNKKLLSAGGGVFTRSLKSIAVTPEMKLALGLEGSTYTPDELIQHLLKAPVDMLFNGGIGTYVKSSTESHADAGDRTNERCRINGEELRCKVVCEGGNLGFTQLGRIEYALNSGLINTDFIDNAAGVNCSDHEVNLKILLNNVMTRDELTLKDRNKLLASLTSEISELVLLSNYAQAMCLSLTAFTAVKNIQFHADYIRYLEAHHVLNRRVEFLPDDKTLVERKVAKSGLTRPELAVLLAYTKIYLEQEILNSSLPEDAYFHSLLASAFPKQILKKYPDAMNNHQLKRIIIATQLANDVVNTIGILFVYQMHRETGASIAEVICAYVLASTVFEINRLQPLIEALDFKIPLTEQIDMITNIHNLIRLATRWFLQENRMNQPLTQLINTFSKSVNELGSLIPNLMGGVTKEYLDTLTQQFETAGLSKTIATKAATYRASYTSLNIIEVANNNNFDLTTTAKVYFACGESMNLLWFRDQIAMDTQEGEWNKLAKLSIRDELDNAQRMLTVLIMKSTSNKKDVQKRIDEWITKNQKIVSRWKTILAYLHTNKTLEYTMFFVVIHEFIRLLNGLQK